MSENDWLNAFGDNLRDMLESVGMSQRELAEQTGLSTGTISKYIHKQSLPGIKAIVNIAYVLDCSMDDLIDFGCMIE